MQLGTLQVLIQMEIFKTEMPDSTKLTCYKKDNSIIWNNPFYDECYVSFVLSTREINEEKYRVFPNPVKDKLRIEIPKNESGNYVISIFNLFGKVIANKIYNQAGIIEINTTSVKNSFYILQIEIDNKIYRQKFIKE